MTIVRNKLCQYRYPFMNTLVNMHMLASCEKLTHTTGFVMDHICFQFNRLNPHNLNLFSLWPVIKE